MKNYHKMYIKHEDITWNWSFNADKKSHKLVIFHNPSKESLSGEIPDLKNSKRPLTERKKDLYDSLIQKLESILFD